MRNMASQSIRKAIANVMEGARSNAPVNRKSLKQVAEESGKYAALPKEKLVRKLKDLEQEMYQHARNLEFEEAARLRDEIHKLKEEGLIDPDRAAS